MSERKIALVGFRLNKGGCGKVMANLSNYFSAQGFKVHLIIFHDDLGYDYSGELFNLGKLKSDSNTIFNKIRRFWQFQRYIKQHDFDYIIDFRFRKKILQELLIAKWIYKTKAIYTVHSSKLEVYMPNFSFLTRYIYNKSFKIVSITNAMQKLIVEKHGLKNVMRIYNPINIGEIQLYADESIDLEFDYIIAVGEYNNNVKQFDSLIKSYSKSLLPKKNIALVILGTGSQKDYLLSVARARNVERFVHLLGFKKNPYKYMKRAKFLVLSSEYEGFGMVIIEALASEIPVVAFDCPTGPNEIIIHKENGLLVENQNIESFTESMNLMLEDRVLAKKCKENAKRSVEKFDVSNIGEQWINLLNRMI